MFANNYSLREIAQEKVAVLTLNDPVFTDIMPITSENTDEVVWQQRDSYRGLMQPRSLGGPYSVITREGQSTYKMKPGYYGDQKVMDEQFLVSSRQIGTTNAPIDLTVEQGKDQDHLLTRAIQRLKLVAWKFVCTGAYSVLDAMGNVIAADATSITPFTVAVAWSDHANSTPLADLRKVKTRHRGKSVNFGKNAKLYLNSTDVNHLLSNTNQNDLGAKRFIQVSSSSSVSQPLSLADVNTYLLGCDLPQIVEWDDTYIDDAGTTQLYIADGFGALIGARDLGEPVANFIMTRNAEMLMSGEAVVGNGANGKVTGLDNLFYNFALKRTPARGISSMGFNGAPAVFFPSAVVPFRT